MAQDPRSDEQRRRLLKVAGASTAAGWAWPAPAAIVSGIQAFAGRPSVRAGAELALYARDPTAPAGGRQVSVTATRFGWPDRLMGSSSAVLRNPAVPANADAGGCLEWGPALRFAVPLSWPSGLYHATFGSGASQGCAPFVVRPAAGAPRARILVQVPIFTAHAYNPYGGRSLYEYNSTGGVRGSRVSLARPLAEPGNNSFDPWQPPLVRWLARNGHVADFCTSLDLHTDPTVLDGYQLFITAGHDEYWSRPMRDRLDAFVAAGGNAVVLSGNTCFWQVRIETAADGAPTLVCHKSAAADPGGTPQTKTDMWTLLATPDPENRTMGSGFAAAGASWTNSLPRPDTPWVVGRGGHWAFATSGLATGSRFAGEWVGYETDASSFRLGLDGRPYRDGLDGTPAEWRILAQADATRWDAQAKALGLPGERSGHGSIGLYCRGGRAGTVFHAGSTDWVYGLLAELNGAPPEVTSVITQNVVSRLSGPWQEPSDVLEWRAAGGGYYTIGTEAPAGAALSGAVFAAYPRGNPGFVPVYRARAEVEGADGPRHLLTTSSRLQGLPGWRLEGVAFYVPAQAGPRTRPVYEYRATDARGLLVYRYGTSAVPPAGWTASGVAFQAAVG